ncbi:MAG: hypothetical protein R6U95_10070 [Bacteroidales bacterium]
MMKKVSLLFVITVGISLFMNAQNTYFTGMGRALFTIDEMTDELHVDEQQRASAGYTTFDLGVNVESKGLMRAGAIIRARNEFGGFYADGSSTLAIRQMQVEGTIGKYVKYELGDIYMHQTPYTIWNFNESFIDYEADIFSLRRDVVNYENYFIDNNWRMQGVHVNSTFRFMNGIESIGVQAYGARLIESDLLTIPDRLLFGGKASVVQSTRAQLGLNAVAISDIVGTVEASEINYHNEVYTSDFIFKCIEKNQVKLQLLGEAGYSFTDLVEESTSTDKNKDDYFFDLGAKLLYTPKNSFGLELKYRDVGPNFNSPAAQTRRIIESDENYSLESFPHFSGGEVLRNMTMLDRVSQEYGLYNTGISTVLMDFLPQYNNIEPYGQATPNRKGLSAVFSYSDSLDIVAVTLKGDFLSEIYAAGDATTQKHRKFTGLQGGVEYAVNKSFDWEKSLIVKAGGAYELTTRDGDLPIDLQSTSIDIGVNAETIKNLHVLLGAKVLQAQGDEFLVVLNRLNEVTSGSEPVSFDFNETLCGAGFQYDFSNTAYFSAQYMVSNYDNNKPGEEKYTFTTNQWFFTFNISF